MQLRVPYWYFNQAFTDEECEEIIRLGRRKAFSNPEETKPRIVTSAEERDAIRNLTFDDELRIGVSSKTEVRDCKISWLNTPWIYDRLKDYVFQANQLAGWKWDIEGIEGLQYTEYDIGDHYDWHTDGPSDSFGAYNTPDQPGYNGNIRKISISICLSDPDEFEGGDLLFSDPHYLLDVFGNNGEEQPYKVKHLRKKGAMVLFPSFQMHKVTPVTKGMRCALVTWVMGKPWK